VRRALSLLLTAAQLTAASGAFAQGNDGMTPGNAPQERRDPPGAVGQGAGTIGDVTTGQSGTAADPQAPGTGASDAAMPEGGSEHDPPAGQRPEAIAACDALPDPQRRASCRDALPR
jgi:hypothetical protein